MTLPSALHVRLDTTYQQMAEPVLKVLSQIAKGMSEGQTNAVSVSGVMDFQKVPIPLVFRVKKNALEAATLQIFVHVEPALMVSTSVMTTARVLPVLLGALCASNSGTTVC